jgi:uncharacterized membrane protein YdjX (TVP38/TMEM64 family)
LSVDSQGSGSGSARPVRGFRVQRSTAIRLALAVLAVAALLVLGKLFGHRLGVALPRVAAFLDGLGIWGPVAFVLGYALAAVAFVPGSLLTLAAGALFGLVKGTVLVLLGATLGASLAFLIARYAARRRIEERLRSSPRFAAIDRAIASQGLRIAFLLRLSPVFPFNLLNYALGVTRVRFRDSLLACLGMLPGTLLYVYYGKVGGDVAAIASGVQTEKGWAGFAVLALGLAATIAVSAIVARLASRALKEATDV